MRNSILLPLLILTGSPATLFSQEHKQEYPVNFGLSKKQATATLPVSSTRSLQVEKTGKNNVAATLIPDDANQNLWRLAGGWKLAEEEVVTATPANIFNADFDTSRWLNAVVPGTVLTTLVAEGTYPDPFYGLNNLLIPDDLCRKEWWYRLAFEAPHRNHGKTWLIFDGINYKADIWLNGHKLGSQKGAFIQGKYDVTDYLSDSNVLAVKIYPPHNPGIPHEQSAKAGVGPNGGQLCFDGPTFICSEGWDWLPGIRDRNIGLWQDVWLKYTDEVTLDNPRIVTDLPLPSTDYADIRLSFDIQNHSGKEKSVVLKGEIDDISFELPVKMNPRETRRLQLTPQDIPTLRIQNPKLWWPNGYGDPDMYTLSLTVMEGDCLSDSMTVPFGVRELSYELSVATPEGKELRIDYSPTDDIQKESIPFYSIPQHETDEPGVVIARLKPDTDISGLKVLPKDGTSPYLVVKCNGERILCRGGNWGMDDGLKRATRERLEPAFRLHKDAGFNMIRNWTGESTEELFYTLCDEYGMLVWNDFWLSTEGVNQNVNDEDLFIDNARDVVRRFRNHPSIALWCPRNEGYAPTSLNDELVEIVTKEDGTRHYNPNSRYMNLRTSGPWHHLDDITDYYLNRAKGFSTEVGAPSVPTAESMEKFIPESERWPVSDTWYYHDLHRGLPEYINAIAMMYGEPDSLADFCKKAQIVNYDRYRAIFESWNSRMWSSTTGVLLWMSHPAWPSVEWQTYSWDFETPGAYFGSKKACERVHLQRNPVDLSVAIINTARQDIEKAISRATRMDLSGNILWTGEVEVKNIGNNSKKNIMVFPPLGQEYTVIDRLELIIPDGATQTNDYIVNSTGRYHDLTSLPHIFLNGRIVDREPDKITFEVHNPGTSVAVTLKFNIRNPSTGEALLPAYFNDGYINLMPGETRVLTVGYNGSLTRDLALYVEGYNVDRQKIIDL